MITKKTAGFTTVIWVLLCLWVFPQNNSVKLNLMPVPQKVELTSQKFRLDSSFTVQISGHPASRIFGYADRMLRRLSRRTDLFFSQDYLKPGGGAADAADAAMYIYVERPGIVKLFEDESYKLSVDSGKIKLSAVTDIGALRGIETFLQLLHSDTKGYFFPGVIIKDYPRFPWRGLMIDVSRHFMPLAVIKRNIDGMAAVKLNVLHLHLSDDQGFRVECRTFPKLTGMGSDGLFYTQAQIKDIIRYANERGIRVVPEFDLPGHSTSWFVGYPQYASAPGPYKIERRWGTFDPTFDPTKNSTYDFLDKFFKEMCGLFPDEYMHIGGDENNGRQWNNNPAIRKFMKDHNIRDNNALQSYFNGRLLKILTKYHKKMMGWDEILHPGVPKNIVIQSWRGIESLKNAAAEGYQVVLSNGYYIDLNQPASYHYLIDPVPDSLSLTGTQKKMVLGGEAAMWSEFVSAENIDSRIWPRTAAIAERFWSEKNHRNVDDMYARLKVISYEFENLGLAHIKNQRMMIRRLAGTGEVKALTNLISVLGPVKNYERASTEENFKSYYPLTRVVDASVPDPPAARDFKNLVEIFLNGNNKDTDVVNRIRRKLTEWKNNDINLEKTIERSPDLKEIEPLSTELSSISEVGLKALNYILNKRTAVGTWAEKSINLLEKAKLQHGEVQIIVVTPIEKLVYHAVKNNYFNVPPKKVLN